MDRPSVGTSELNNDFLGLANVALSVANYDEALRYYTKVLESDANSAEAWIGRAFLLYRKALSYGEQPSNYDKEARTYLARALEVTTDDDTLPNKLSMKFIDTIIQAVSIAQCRYFTDLAMHFDDSNPLACLNKGLYDLLAGTSTSQCIDTISHAIEITDDNSSLMNALHDFVSRHIGRSPLLETEGWALYLCNDEDEFNRFVSYMNTIFPDDTAINNAIRMHINDLINRKLHNGFDSAATARILRYTRYFISVPHKGISLPDVFDFSFFNHIISSGIGADEHLKRAAKAVKSLRKKVLFVLKDADRGVTFEKSVKRQSRRKAIFASLAAVVILSFIVRSHNSPKENVVPKSLQPQEATAPHQTIPSARPVPVSKSPVSTPVAPASNDTNPDVRDAGHSGATSGKLQVPQTASNNIYGRETDEMKSFISNYLKANEKKDMDKVLSFYGDAVNYYQKGTVSKVTIREDKRKYFDFCNKLSYTLANDLQKVHGEGSDTITLTFTYSFFIEAAKKNVRGTARNKWIIGTYNTNPQIIEENQTVIERVELPKSLADKSSEHISPKEKETRPSVRDITNRLHQTN